MLSKLKCQQTKYLRIIFETRKLLGASPSDPHWESAPEPRWGTSVPHAS